METELPFGTDTARRLMAISEAYEKLAPEKLAMLPRPWQALYALRALTADELQRAMEAGEITPDMSERAAKGVDATLAHWLQWGADVNRPSSPRRRRRRRR